MDGNHQSAQGDLAAHLIDRFGLLLTQRQLAELLGRSIGGLRYSLWSPSRDASEHRMA